MRVAVWRGHPGSPSPRRRSALDRVHPSVWSSNHDRFRHRPQHQRCIGARLHQREVTVRGHVAVRAETLPSRFSHRAVPWGRCRPALPVTAAPKRVGSRLCRSANAFEAAVPPRRSTTVGRFRRQALWPSQRFGRFPPHRTRFGSRPRRSAGHQGNPSNQAFQLPQARSLTGAPKRSGSSPCRRRSRPGPPPPRRRSVEDRAYPSD